MAGATFADVIIPELWTPYVVRQALALTAFYQSGVITNDPQLNALASQASPTVNMPFFNDLTGDAEQVIETADLTAAGITTGIDVAAISRRAKMWSSTDLAAQLAGKNPADVIASLVAKWWAEQLQKELFAALNGAFGAANMSGLVLDISGGTGNAAKWSGAAFIDANQLLGDQKANLSAVAMHSATETALEKADLIATIPPSQGGAPQRTYQGKRVIIDDTLPVAGGDTYTSYLFGAGAVGYGEGSPVGFVPTETTRDAKKGSGVDFLINRKTFVMHPRGVKWLGASVAHTEGPSRAELALAANWSRVYDVKDIRIVKFVHKL